MDFGDLKDDKTIQEKIGNFQHSVNEIQKILDKSLSPEDYQKLSLKDKVDYDLFMSYTLNTLYWLYLRTRGEDPTKSDIKNQLNRVKQYMLTAKEAHERQTIRPKLDKPAAARFIKHGLRHTDDAKVQQPPNKKIKFAD